MSNLYKSSEYKNKIINLLLKNDNFIKLLSPTPSKCKDIDIIDVILGGEWDIDGRKHEEQGYIFDYNFVTDTVTEDKTFVFVETDIDTVRNNIFTDFNLYICIFTSKNLVKITNNTTPTVQEVKEMGLYASRFANRIDALCDVVDKTLNSTNEIKGVGRVEPATRGYVTMYSPHQKYYGKCLKYHILNYNEGGDECGN